MSTQRQPKGIPVGGQFAANQHDEAPAFDESYGESNELLSAYWSRITEHGGDPYADAQDIIDSIDSGEFDTMHTPESRREARAALEELSSRDADDVASILQDRGSLLRLIDEDQIDAGKFSSLDDRLLYDLGDSMWSGDTSAPTGNFTVVHDNGTHVVIQENSDGVVTFQRFDDEAAADNAYDTLAQKYTDWEMEGEEFITITGDQGGQYVIRHREGGYSVHDEYDNLLTEIDTDSDEEMFVEEKVREKLRLRGM